MIVYTLNVLVALHVISVDPTVIYNIPSLALAVIVLVVVGVAVFGLVIAIVGAVVSIPAIIFDKR